MSDNATAFAALESILDGEWDRYLVRLRAGINQQMLAAAAPLLVAEAVAAERAKTASALAAMKRERAALEPYWNGGGPIFGYDMCIELLESALAAGSETTKEDGPYV